MTAPLDHAPRTAPVHSYTYSRISFWLNGKPVCDDIPPAQTTLEYLQKTRGLFGTKCSCNEGDCGACTVVVARPCEGKILYEAVNSCLLNAAKLQGKHLITIEGLGTPDHLHPIQQAMLDHHSTQCGYCSPGFVMSLFALLATQSHPSEEDILAALEGNLCRCTGYDSILRATRELARNFTPSEIVPAWCRALEPSLFSFKEPVLPVARTGDSLCLCDRYIMPTSLDELASILAGEPDHVIMGGGTDLMVQMNIQRRKIHVLVDLALIPGLDQITITPKGVSIGANVTYSGLLRSGIVRTDLPALYELVTRIASTQIRNFATLAGNIANASPIGDTLPLLLVLDASLLLFSAAGERTLPLREFFLAYRQTALQPGEIIKAVLIPVPPKNAYIRAEKAAKRKAVDISSVVTAVRIETRDGRISHAEFAAGGVAVVPMLSKKFHNALADMELQGLHPHEIAGYVASEFEPITDVRGSREYRIRLLRNHVLGYLKDFLDRSMP
jgi:xanthine dehydrogenase small subunit